MPKRNFPSNKERASSVKIAKAYDFASRLSPSLGLGNNEQIGRAVADLGTAGLVPNKAGKKMQAGKKLKTPQMGRDIPLPKSK